MIILIPRILLIILIFSKHSLCTQKRLKPSSTEISSSRPGPQLASGMTVQHAPVLNSLHGPMWHGRRILNTGNPSASEDSGLDSVISRRKKRAEERIRSREEQAKTGGAAPGHGHVKVANRLAALANTGFEDEGLFYDDEDYSHNDDLDEDYTDDDLEQDEVLWMDTPLKDREAVGSEGRRKDREGYSDDQYMNEPDYRNYEDDYEYPVRHSSLLCHLIDSEIDDTPYTTTLLALTPRLRMRKNTLMSPLMRPLRLVRLPVSRIRTRPYKKQQYITGIGKYIRRYTYIRLCHRPL